MPVSWADDNLLEEQLLAELEPNLNPAEPHN